MTQLNQYNVNYLDAYLKPLRIHYEITGRSSNNEA